MAKSLLRITPESAPAVPLVTRLPVLAEGDDRGLIFLLPEANEGERRRRRKNLASSVVIDTGIWVLFVWLLMQTPAIKHRLIVTTPLYLPEQQTRVEPRPHPVAIKRTPIVAREHIEIVKTPPPDVRIAPPKVVAPPEPPKPRELVVKNVSEFKPLEVAAVTPKIAPPKPQHIAGFDVAQSVPGPEGRAKIAPRLGGFGSQTAAEVVAVVNAKPNVGSFGEPNAWGGTGAGGARIGKKVVEGTGFGSAGDQGGSGYANYGRGPAHHGNGATPGVSGFDERVATATPARRATAVLATPRTKPPEIVEKPKPAYTEAALKARIEGEVVLRVILGAGGDVRVLGIVQGLGYGLDQTAQDAARRIRFKPATQDGQPVDYTAILHITFSLAY